MYYRIYLDTLFLVNFIMDYAVLSLVAGIMQFTSTHLFLRRILAAGTGAAWSLAVVIFGLFQGVWNYVGYMVIAAVMVRIVSGKTGWIAWFKGIGVMYAVTFALGVLFHVLYYYTSVGYFIHTASAGTWIVVIGVVIGAPVIKKLLEVITYKISVSGTRTAAVLEIEGKEIRIAALCDTGNSLRDPFYGGAPVSVVESEAVESVLKEPASHMYHLIPYSSVGQENGLIPVVRFERLTVTMDKKVFEVNKPWVALYSGHLSTESEFQMILNPGMLRETKGLINKQGV